MQRVCVAETDIEVSRLGLGTVKFGRNEAVKYPHAFALPSDQEVDALLKMAHEQGINLLDTAPAYGSSEERLGKLLTKRHEWVISTKAGEDFAAGESTYNFSQQHITESVERSLQRLRTDYLDILLIHSNGDDVAIIEKDNVFATLEALKQAGKIRAYGMSTKTIEGGMQTLAQSHVAMVAYNPLYKDEQPVITTAAEKKKSIFVKKVFASGHFPAREALKFVLTTEGVTSVIIGTINRQHLQDNIEMVRAVK